MLCESFFSLMPMFAALFWAVLFFLDGKGNLPRTYLGVFFSVAFVNYMAHASFFLREYRLFAFLENVWVFTSLVSYPLFYYYLRLITRDTRVDWRWLWITLPAAALSLFSFALYFHMSDGELSSFVHHGMYHEGGAAAATLPVRLQMARGVLFKWVYAVQLAAVVFFGVRMVNRYNERLQHFYSDTQGRDLTSFRTLLFGMLFASVVSAFSVFIGKDYFVGGGLLLAVPSTLHTAFLYWVAFAGYNQRFTIADFNRDMGGRQAESTPGDGDGSELARLIEKAMDEDMAFTKADLKLSDLAAMLHTNRSYVSAAINSHLHTDFCTYVNRRRVDYAKRLMDTPANSAMSLDAIAEMAGFSNPTTFYRAFKKYAGTTPGEYLHRARP